MYTVKEAANLLGVNPHKIRYYTNQNLTPHLSRSKNGVRLFDDTDIKYPSSLNYFIILQKIDLFVKQFLYYLPPEQQKKNKKNFPL